MSVFGHSYGTGISGRLFLKGQEIRVRTVDEAIAHGIAYATEDRKRYGLNLIEDVKRNISAAGLSRLARRGWVNENEEYRVAGRFRQSMNIKVPTVSTAVGTLSGGNQQKVVLSKWIFTEPDVLILDEPTRGIDVGAKAEVQSLIDELAAEGLGVVLVSSDAEELVEGADRVVVLRDGVVVGTLTGDAVTTEELLAQIAGGTR